MEEIQNSIDMLAAKLDTKASKAQVEELRTELRDELASKAQVEELRTELRDELASKSQLDVMTEMLDVMRQTLDGVLDRMENQEIRQVKQDLKMEEFRSEIRVFAEGIHSNRSRIEKLEQKSA